MTEFQREQAISLLSSSFLFSGVQPGLIAHALQSDGVQLLSYATDQIIYSPTHFERGLSFILSGAAVVHKGDNQRRIIISKLTPGDLFGAITLFSSESEYATVIIAQGNCTVLFLPEQLVEQMLQQSFAMVKNLIAYLSSRIRFLNRRIDAFTGNNAESKLAIYLLDSKANAGVDTITLPYSLSALSEALSIGRASLYRALQLLEQQGIIERQGRVINIKDASRLSDIINQ